MVWCGVVWCGVVVVVVVRTECCTCMSVHTRTRMQLIKMGQCQCTDPFGWTDQPAKNPTPFASESRFQASPEQKPHPTPSRGKRLRGTPASPPTPPEEGGRNLFHRLGVKCPWSGMLTGGTLTRVFLVRRTLLTMLPPSSTE